MVTGKSGHYPYSGSLTLSLPDSDGITPIRFREVSPWVWTHVVVSIPIGGPGPGSVHGIGAVALSLVRPSTHPLVLPVVPGRGPWPASQGFRRRVAGTQGMAPSPGEIWGVGRVVLLVFDPPVSLHGRGRGS